MSAQLDELLRIVARLRAPDGCPWDRAQTFASIAPHAIEEAYEVADAVARGSMHDLEDELGDLLFQVVFQAQLAKEIGEFDFDDVAAAVCRKLQRRHPHVFGDCAPPGIAEQSAAWEDIKAAERSRAAQGSVSAVQGVPRALPALLRACKLSKRAARVGFDFEHAGQSADKVAEELAEVRAEMPAPSAAIFEEIGDLLFAAANLARKLEVDAEAALRAANDKFERRFRAMEFLAAQRGQCFADLGLAAQENLWLAVKLGESSAEP